MLGERADAELDARQIQPFARTQLAADRDDALHIVALDALDDELHEAVVEKEPVARFHHARQRLEAHRDALRVADDVFIRQRETCRPARAGSVPASIFPSRIFGPGRSAMIATRRPVARSAARMRVTDFARAWKNRRARNSAARHSARRE